MSKTEELKTNEIKKKRKEGDGETWETKKKSIQKNRGRDKKHYKGMKKKEKMEKTDGEKRCRNNEVDTSREGKN